MYLDTFKAYLKNRPETRYIDAFYSDLSGVVRGKRYPVNAADKLFSGGVMMPGSCFLLSVTGDSMDPCGLGFSDGDPDSHAFVLPETLLPMPWAQIPTAQVQLSLQDQAGQPFYYEPRNVLKRVLEKFFDIGLKPVVAFELEFYLFDLNRNANNQLQPPLAPLTGNRNMDTQVYSLAELEDYSLFIDDVIKACEAQHIKTGAISAEYAPGQFEINLMHNDDPVRAADQAAMFKRIVRGVARQHNMRASFMSKPYLNNAGNGLHIHLSLLDAYSKNVFDGGGDFGTEECISDTLNAAMGGLLEIHPEAMAFFAPNCNAFRRYVPDRFVPTSPSWGMENRSVAVRIPKSSGNARRIEHRAAGADANPYLLLASLLAGIHYGISEQLEPGPEWRGNASAKLSSQIPFDLVSAIGKARQGEIINYYLGEDYVKAYCECKRLEFREFRNRNITDEARWYL